ncbi:MAG: HAMP domain-containing sensor histidine kinase [Dehalococcoidia bacterium]
MSQHESTLAPGAIATPRTDAIIHDLNNVLAGIAGSLDGVLADLRPGAPAEAPLRDALAGVFRAAGLLRQLAGQAPGPAGSFALPGIIAETVRLARGCRAASAIELPAAPESARGRGDGTEFQRALLNVILNALEANPPGGRVRLTYRYGNGMHVISVTDEGPGIPDALRDRVFEPYFTTRSRGSGLGLASARSAMLGLGGDLTLVASSERGTTFAVQVPEEVLS